MAGVLWYRIAPVIGKLSDNNMLLSSQEITIPTSAATYDYTLYATPIRGAESAIFSAVLLNLTSVMGGTGNITFTIGITAGGTEFLASKNITSATGVGPIGLTTAEVGSLFTAANMYNARIAAENTPVILRIVVSGSITGTPKVLAEVYGRTI